MRNLLTILLLFLASFVSAQELNCQIQVSSQQIQGTNRDVFTAMQQKIYEFMNTINREFENVSADDAKQALELMQRFDLVLGIYSERPKQDDLSEEVEKLIADRQQARKDKDFARADEIRDQLTSMGIELKDTPQGITWKKL